MEKLPKAEFDIMKEIWSNKPPITSSTILNSKLGRNKKWKPTTVNTLLKRLVDRKFLSRKREKGEYHYVPLIYRNTYLEFETNAFLERYHENSITSLSASLLQSDVITDKVKKELMKLIEEEEPK